MAASFYAIVLYISLTTIFFSIKVNSTETTSFSISRFVSDQQNLIFQGDTYTVNDRLILTKAAADGVGRALYSAPINLWDSQTGNVANFITSFTFVIHSPRAQNIADGLTFFIAPVGTTVQSGGGYLGVFNSENYEYALRTVAVEFDTFYNTGWDPSSRHIGINVNSIRSRSTVPWNLQNRVQANVVIKYDAATSVLSVNSTYPNSISSILTDVVRIINIVPEWVRIGFSATTGTDFSSHEILSWSFHSELGGASSSNQAADA